MRALAGAALIWALASSAVVVAEPVGLPEGCLALATVVGGDCSVRHLARCADYAGGVSSFLADRDGRLIERVDRAQGLLAERVWRRSPVEDPSARAIAAATLARTRIGGFWIEIDLDAALEPGWAGGPPPGAVELAVVQRARSASGEGLTALARRLKALRVGERLSFGLELAPTPRAVADGDAPEPLRLSLRAVRAPDAAIAGLSGGGSVAPRRARVLRFAARSVGAPEAEALVLSETRFFDPSLAAVLGRQVEGVIGGAAERRDGAPIAVFRLNHPGLLDANADQSVAACSGAPVADTSQ